MKTRPARSFEKAVQTILSSIGEEEAARVTDRSVSMVRKWSDPDAPSLPSVKHALALDKAFIKASPGPAPISAVYQHRLEKLVSEIDLTGESLVGALFNLHGAVGALTRNVADNLGDERLKPMSLSPRLRETLLADIETLTQEASDLETVIRRS